MVFAMYGVGDGPMKQSAVNLKLRGLTILVGSPHAGRVGGDRWEWDMTTPNTPLYRRGRS